VDLCFCANTASDPLARITYAPSEALPPCAYVLGSSDRQSSTNGAYSSASEGSVRGVAEAVTI
jgi:hypothetical protein